VREEGIEERQTIPFSAGGLDMVALVVARLLLLLFHRCASAASNS
jgi:hypothetical protein